MSKTFSKGKGDLRLFWAKPFKLLVESPYTQNQNYFLGYFLVFVKVLYKVIFFKSNVKYSLSKRKFLAEDAGKHKITQDNTNITECIYT